MLAAIYISLFFFLVALALAILFIFTIVKTLNAVSPANRKMPPQQAWLLLVPLFNLVWGFILAKKLSGSIYAEFTSKGLPVDRQPTYSSGLAYCISFCLSMVPVWNMVYTLPMSFMAIIFWVIYWVKIVEYKSKLDQLHAN